MSRSLRLAALPLLTLAAVALSTSPATAAEPKLTPSKAALAASLKCTPGVNGAKRTPIMLVTGTGATGDEAYAIGKAAFDTYGAPVCWVNFPNATTADIGLSVQFLVHGVREMSRRAQRKIAIIGISQGGLLPRVALTYWPSLRAKVSDVLSAAGTHHGTTLARCKQSALCTPASWQQTAGSRFLRALNTFPDETPGPTSWTTIRSSSDETVQPTTGPRPSSSLAGATNILIQNVCPGRKVTHIGTALDSVTFAAFADAIRSAGPARVSRLPRDVCSRLYAPGLDEAQTTNLITAGAQLTSGRSTSEPRVRREPALRPFMR